MGNDDATVSGESPAGLVSVQDSEVERLSWITRLTLDQIIERLEILSHMVKSEQISQETADKFSKALKGIAIDEIVPRLTDDEKKHASSKLITIFGGDFKNSDWQGIFEDLAYREDYAEEYSNERDYAKKAIERLSALLPPKGVKEFDSYRSNRWSNVLVELQECEKQFVESSDRERWDAANKENSNQGQEGEVDAEQRKADNDQKFYKERRKAANNLWSFIGAHPQMWEYVKKDILNDAEKVADQMLLNDVYDRLPR